MSYKSSNTESNQESETPTTETESQDTEGKKYDELGYEITSEEETEKPVEGEEESEKPEEGEEESDKPVEKPATGYNDSEEEESEEETDKPEEGEEEEEKELTDEEKALKEIEDTVKGLPDFLDKEKVKKFALDNKLNKDQLLAYSNLVKEEQAAAEKTRTEALKATRKAWVKELKEDPEFGGANFDKNVDRVEKVLEKYMPSMKKVLTEKGGMVPPYIMRDLLGLAKVLNQPAKFVGGEPPVPPKKDEGNFLEELYK